MNASHKEKQLCELRLSKPRDNQSHSCCCLCKGLIEARETVSTWYNVLPHVWGTWRQPFLQSLIRHELGHTLRGR